MTIVLPLQNNYTSVKVLLLLLLLSAMLRPLLRLLVSLLILPSLLVSWHLWNQHWWKLYSADNNKGLRISVSTSSSRRRSSSSSSGRNDEILPNDDAAAAAAAAVLVGVFLPVVPHHGAKGNIEMIRVMSPPLTLVGDLVEIAQHSDVLLRQKEPNEVIWLQPNSKTTTTTTTSSGSGHSAWCLLHFLKTNDRQDREDEWCQQASKNNLLDWTGDYYYQYEASSKTNQNVILHVQELFPSRSWFPFLTSWNKSRHRQHHHQTFPTTTYPTTPELSPLQQALWVHPATSFWLALNVLLAFVYWNLRIPVSAVAQLVYPQQQQAETTSQQDPQIWRLLTGATAHFELWHLGFNMMSLSALGQQLENGNGKKYTSIEFWFYNFAVLLWTGVVWLGFQYGIQRFLQSRRSRSTTNTTTTTTMRGEHHHHVSTQPRPTVGFSGVLFAWMVVAALENQVSCPIPFMPTVCFHAFHIGSSFQFNWGPVVTLVLMQLLLPRASWTGHLAGVLVGFAMHWGELPALLLHPAVALPGLYYLYLQFVRRITSTTSSTSITRWFALEDAEDDTAAAAASAGGSQKQYLSLLRPTLVLLFYGATLLFSVFAFGLWSTLTLSYVWVLLFFHLFTKLGGLGVVSCGRDHPSIVATRGLLLTAVTVQVADAMTLGAWLAWIRIQMWEQGHLRHYMGLEFFVIMMRSVMLLFTIFVCVRKLTPVREEMGIFYYVFYHTVLSPCESILIAAASLRRGGSLWLSLQPPIRRVGDGDVWTALGPGCRLGGGRDTSVTANSPDDDHERELSQLL